MLKMGVTEVLDSIFDGFSSRIKIWLVTEVRWRLPNFSQSPFFLKRVLGTQRVPVSKVHARFVLSKHVRQKKFFTLIKLWKVEKVTEVRAITVL